MICESKISNCVAQAKDKLVSIDVCVDCGGPADFYGVDPYNSEINGDDTEDWHCSDCAQARAEEI